MTPSEIRAKEAKECGKLLEEKQKNLFDLRLKLLTGQLTKNREIRETRKDIARLFTILKTKEGDVPVRKEIWPKKRKHKSGKQK